MATLKHSFLALALLASPFLAQAQNNASDGGYTYYYELGANAYVRKPVEFADFAAAAKTVGLFWLLLNEPAPVQRASP